MIANNMNDKIYADVSAVIPCYNCSNTIHRAIKSIWNQTLKPFEVILVDDCSNDNDETKNTLSRLKKQYPEDWIKLVLLEKNGGPGNARNIGWNMSKGKYIAFLDADDAWHINKIEIQYNIMLNNPGLSLCGHGYIDWNKRGKVESRVDNINIKPISLFNMFISNRFFTRTVMIKRNISERFDSKMYRAEDFLLWCCILAKGYNGGVFDQKLAYIYESDEETLTTDLEKSEKGELLAYKKMFTYGIINKRQLYFWDLYSLLKYLLRKIRRLLQMHYFYKYFKFKK